MKIVNFKTAGLLMLMAVMSCSGGDKKTELTKLQKKREALNEKIQKLENETGSDTASSKILNAPVVAVKKMEPTMFRHFIEVQGHVDGEENLGISARTMGTVEQVNVDMGDHVTKGEILARLDDAVFSRT